MKTDRLERYRFLGAYLRVLWISLILFASALAPLTAQAEGGGGNSDYNSLVAKAASGQNVDFAALREAYARSPNYQPYGGAKLLPLTREMVQAGDGGDCQKAIMLALTILEMNFTYFDAHMMLAYCSKKAGDAAAEEKEAKIAIGLVKSILASGDGKTPQTAFRVITVSEGYSVLKILRLRMSAQRLISHEGHAYDVLDAKGSGDRTVSLYFRIDGILGYASNAFRPKQ
jgi:Domain of unknown function (DUF4919)